MNKTQYCKTVQELIECLMDRVTKNEKVNNINTINPNYVFTVTWKENETANDKDHVNVSS